MPEDWSDREGWDRYFTAEIATKRRSVAMAMISSLQFAGFALEQGGRVWFSGCGLDEGPPGFAALGATVVATDFSAVAIEWQRARVGEPMSSVYGWKEFLDESKLTERSGSLTALQQDFTLEAPPGPFDVCINRKAFQGLNAAQMAAAARLCFGALRPGGAAIIDTMNVQGELRNVLEDSLLSAGFFIPFSETDRWFRDRLASTGIVYVMVLGRPLIPHWNQYAQDAEASRERDKKILATIDAEYRERLKTEQTRVETRMKEAATRVAHVVYSTG